MTPASTLAINLFPAQLIVLVLKAQYNLGLGYLRNHILLYKMTQPLRLAEGALLHVPPLVEARLMVKGAGPSLWWHL